MGTNISKVGIREEPHGKETGGHFATESVTFTATASGVKDKDVTPKVPIALLSAHIHVKGLSDGDKIELIIGPETEVDTLDAGASASSSVITVPQDVIDMFLNNDLYVGQEMHLEEGATKDFLGLITAFDSATKTVTVETATVNAFGIGSKILITTKMTPNILGTGYVQICSGNDTVYQFGEDKIGTSRIEAGQKIRVRYTETGALTPTVTLMLSYLY